MSANKKSTFQLHLYFPFILAIMLMSVLTIYSMVYMQENTLHKSKASTTDQFKRFLDNKVDKEAAAISEFIRFIQNRDDIAQLFEIGDKQSLYKAVKGIYKDLKQNIELTHMYFIKPEGKVLLRVHDHKRDLDIVKRKTFLKAKEKQSLFYGLEFGVKKNYTLRVVTPWVVDGRVIGYLELGKEIDKIIDEYAGLLNIQVYLAVKKGLYSNASKFVKENLMRNVETREHYIVYQTFDVPDQMGSILNGTIVGEDITFQEREYSVSKEILSDVSDNELGYFVFLDDVTMEHDIIFGSVKVFTGILIIAEILLFVFGFMLINKKEKDIYILTSELNTQKEDLGRFNVKLQKLFDLQKNIVLLSDGKQMLMANQAMYDYFGLDDLEEFLSHYSCICERFVENDNFFHLGKVPEEELWVETIQRLPAEQRIVAMLDDELSTHVFSVALNQFDKSDNIISFTDISSTMLEQVKLLRKVTHDKLTGALNREFLENNIIEIIEEAKLKNLGVILADIDYFKRVNDTYGHNRGDEVLKQFVMTIETAIRHTDYLVRWGGEEFIILMRVDSVESLKKATEHICLTIENDHFEEVGNITSSFGVTIYLEGEGIYESIERADQALYQAKENGRNQVRIIEMTK